MNLDHNHEISSSQSLTVNGRQLVNNQEDLTTGELNLLHYCAKYNFPMVRVREQMRSEFKTRDFTTLLMRRVLEKSKDAIFGPGRHRINELIALGMKQRADGGVFEIKLCTSGSNELVGLSIQTPSMRRYALNFGDFLNIDGTHKGNKYNLITSPFTNVCCLGFSRITGLQISKFENKEDTLRGIELFGYRDGSDMEGREHVCMSDGGSAYQEIFEEIGWVHLRCAWHIAREAPAAGGGLGAEHQDFLEAVSNLIYQRFNSPEELCNTFEDLMQHKFPVSKSQRAHSFLKNLYEIREKACLTYTCRHFTAGSVASSRGEGTMSRFKGRGELKKELMQADLYRGVSRIVELAEVRDRESVLALCELIESGKFPNRHASPVTSCIISCDLINFR